MTNTILGSYWLIVMYNLVDGCISSNTDDMSDSRFIPAAIMISLMWPVVTIIKIYIFIGKYKKYSEEA